MRVLNDNAIVSNLLLENQKSWDFNLLQMLMSQEELECIQVIPLCFMFRDDKLVWNFTKNDQLTAKSAYNL